MLLIMFRRSVTPYNLAVGYHSFRTVYSFTCASRGVNPVQVMKTLILGRLDSPQNCGAAGKYIPSYVTITYDSFIKG